MARIFFFSTFSSSVTYLLCMHKATLVLSTHFQLQTYCFSNLRTREVINSKFCKHYQVWKTFTLKLKQQLAQATISDLIKAKHFSCATSILAKSGSTKLPALKQNTLPPNLPCLIVYLFIYYYLLFHSLQRT